METSLPTPMTARVYVNLPEGKAPVILRSPGSPVLWSSSDFVWCRNKMLQCKYSWNENSLFHETGVLKHHVTATICLLPGCCTYHAKYLANWTQKHHHCQPNSTSNTPQTLTYFTALATVLLLNNMQSWGRGSKMLQMWSLIIPLHPMNHQPGVAQLKRA